MSGVIAVVEAGDSPVRAMLAAEALRQAARRASRALAVEVRTARGVLSPLPAAPDADALLLVGEAARAPDGPRRAARRAREDRGGAGGCRRRAGARHARGAGGRRREAHRRHHLLPHRHRPYLHGGRGAGAGGQGAGARDPGGDPGLGRRAERADAGGDRQRRPGADRRRHAGRPLPLRRQAGVPRPAPSRRSTAARPWSSAPSPRRRRRAAAAQAAAAPGRRQEGSSPAPTST